MDPIIRDGVVSVNGRHGRRAQVHAPGVKSVTPQAESGAVKVPRSGD
jgi:hypothetical protein